MALSGAIIGGGPAGLAALRAAIDEGLDATAFDFKSEPGGLWTHPRGLVWPSLRANLSKFSCAFSDFPQPDTTALFPSAAEMASYLRAFTAKFDLADHLELNARVIGAEPDCGGWRLTIRYEDQREEERRFDRLVVASGFFSRELIPAGIDLGDKVSHTASYRDPERYRGQKVLVVGSAFSGCDIAAEIATVAQATTITVRRPFWCLPRMILGRGKRLVPLDLEFYTRESAYRKPEEDAAERAHRRHAYFRGLVGDQSDLPSALRVPDDGQSVPVVISDTFTAAARERKLTIRNAAELDIAAICASPGDHGFDAVVLATGHGPQLDYLPKAILDDLDYVPDDAFQPILLARTVFPAVTKGLAFVGMYRGPYFGVLELQARWACGVFSGRLAELSDGERMDAIEEERELRTRRPRPQFPHPDYVAMADDLARKAGVMPDLAVKPPLGDWLTTGPLLPAHFRLVGDRSDPAPAIAEIERVARYLSSGQ